MAASDLNPKQLSRKALRTKFKWDPLGKSSQSYDTKTKIWTDVDQDNDAQDKQYMEMTEHPPLDARLASLRTRKVLLSKGMKSPIRTKWAAVATHLTSGSWKEALRDTLGIVL